MIIFNTSPLQANKLLSFYHIHFKRTKNIAITDSKNLLWRLHSMIRPYKQVNDYYILFFYTVPVTIKVLTPGFTNHAPVVASCV